MTNLFDKAKSKPVKVAGKSKPVEVQVQTDGLEILAQIDALEKQLKTLKETALRPDVQRQMIDKFLETKGENYKAKDGNATASMELRKRSSISGLSEDEQNLLARHKISMVEIEGDFKLNVKGLTPKKLEEVSKAISSVKGLPEDFLTFDASKARTVTSDTSLDEIFKLNDPDTIKALMPVVGVFAIKPKTSDEMKDVLEAVTGLFQ